MGAFAMTPRMWLCLARSLPAIVALTVSAGGSALPGVCLVLAVWADACAGWVARRAGWSQSPAGVALEGLVDCVSFVAEPAAFVASLCPRRELVPALALFVLGGIYRLARFQVEGLVSGGYRGLPVTYNGYSFPAAALALFYLPGWNAFAVWCVLLPLVAGLMVSTFIVPEV